MRKTFAILALAAGVATSAQAQKAWEPQLGIQGGIMRVKQTGTSADDAIDFIQLPGGTFFNGLFGSPALFAVIPWKDKIALEPQFGLINISTTDVGDATLLSTALRVDYAVTPKIYVAAGGAHTWLSANGNHDGQLGLVTAAGYRLHLTNRLNGRLEANVTFRKKDDSSDPANSYSLLFGVSSRLAGTSARPAARRAASGRAWQPAIGIAGGYLNQHVVGGARDVSGFHIPGPGGDLRQQGSTIGGPATLFAIFPLGNKLAVEPGLDVHALKAASGGGAGTAIALSGRLNYAVAGDWYAAAGVTLTNINFGGVSGTVTGGQAAWGYRFHLTGDIGGRVEFLFDVRAKQEDIGHPPVNTFGVMFGATMPLK